MSVSIAWDAKQVEDLLPMVRPEVAIVDLGLPPRGRAYGTVAGLATVNPVPTTILIPSGDDAAGFAAALASHGRGSHALSLKELLEMALHRGHDARPRAPANNPRPDPSP
jgi:hypothetical protein